MCVYIYIYMLYIYIYIYDTASFVFGVVRRVKDHHQLLHESQQFASPINNL